MKNALMPGVMSEPLPEIGAAPMRAAPMAKPVKKRNPLVNALSAVFEYGAPEAFEAGRQKRMTRDAGNALASGNYEQAANTYLQGGDIEQGLKLRSEGEAQATAKRQQEAQSVLSLFSQMPALQINEMAMSDPANFERMTGMTSEEYLQAAQRSGDPEKFRQFVITKAQAELGQMPAGPAEGKVVNNRLVDPITGEVRGDYSDPTKPIEVNGVLVDPVTYQPVADFRTPTQTGGMTDYERAKLEQDATAASLNGGQPAPDLGDIKGIRETNEKRLQVFQESQRQFQTMTKLANDATGASDVALGFAFFKTIDPTSTVREGEFAQAASSMGLSARTVAALEKLDSGQKFSPQLRKDLLAAAGHAYDLQKRDIEGMVERETAFAQRYGINPDDIVRNPIVDMPAPPPRQPLVSGMLGVIRGAGQPSAGLPPGFVELD